MYQMLSVVVSEYGVLTTPATLYMCKHTAGIILFQFSGYKYMLFLIPEWLWVVSRWQERLQPFSAMAHVA